MVERKAALPLSLLLFSLAAIPSVLADGILLAAGGSLAQGAQLTTPDGLIFLLVQGDGNVVIYNAAAKGLIGGNPQSAIWQSNTAGAANGPFTLLMQQDCNLVLYNSKGQGAADAVWATGTSSTSSQAALPCSALLSSDSGPSLSIIDSNKRVLYSAPNPPTPIGTLVSGGHLAQEGAGSGAAIWSSNTYGSSPAPFTAVMQADCNLVVYKAGGFTAAYAVFQSGTSSAGGVAPCALSVTSSGSGTSATGYLTIQDSRGNVLFQAPGPTPVTTPAPLPSGFSLVWSDEFNGNAVDPSNWGYDLGDGSQFGISEWGNGELEYYTPSAATVSGGALHITVNINQTSGGFSSARLTSTGKQGFAPAPGETLRIEARIQMPQGGLGIWPALWTLADPTDPQGDEVYGTWPASGEIDIMEAVNSLTTLYGTAHYGGPNQYAQSGTQVSSNSSLIFAGTYHVYSVDWTQNTLTWGIDGIPYGSTQSSCVESGGWYSTGAPSDCHAPFDQKFCILLNVAVGGGFPGYPSASSIIASTPFPQTMLVDYVRVLSSTTASAAAAIAAVEPESDPESAEAPASGAAMQVASESTYSAMMAAPAPAGSSSVALG